MTFYPLAITPCGFFEKSYLIYQKFSSFSIPRSFFQKMQLFIEVIA